MRLARRKLPSFFALLLCAVTRAGRWAARECGLIGVRANGEVWVGCAYGRVLDDHDRPRTPWPRTVAAILEHTG